MSEERIFVIESKSLQNGDYIIKTGSESFPVASSESIYAELLRPGTEIKATIENGRIIRIKPSKAKYPSGSLETTTAAPAAATTAPQQPASEKKGPGQQSITGGQPPAASTTTPAPAKDFTKASTLPKETPTITPPVTVPDLFKDSPQPGNLSQVSLSVLDSARTIVVSAYINDAQKKGIPADTYIKEVAIRTIQTAEYLTKWMQSREVGK